MAIFYPPYKKIKEVEETLTAGEKTLLVFLELHLDDSFEIFFKPNIEGNKLTCVILRKNYGALIIQIFDKELKEYSANPTNPLLWHDDLNNENILSPLKQISLYKDTFYDYIPGLLYKYVQNRYYHTVFACALYFHANTCQEVKNFITTYLKKDASKIEKKIKFLGKDSLSIQNFGEILQNSYLLANKESVLFDEKLYMEVKEYLLQKRYSRKERKNIKLNAQQLNLSISIPRQQRIKGAMGSGKTTVLACRAINAYRRTGETVLILTYNITLINYIKSKLQEFEEEVPLENFHVLNYHEFIQAELNNLRIPFHYPTELKTTELKNQYLENNYYSNLSLFENHKDEIQKYATILIDEIQDYKRPWMDIIKQCFLKEGGEYVLFGDEKQNIYGNELDNKDVRTNVIGAPSLLKFCYRSGENIRRLACEFQKHFFHDKYFIDEFDQQMSFDFEEFKGSVEYFNLPTGDPVIAIYEILTSSKTYLSQIENNITLLGSNKEQLMEFEAFYKYKSQKATNTTFANLEFKNLLLLTEYQLNTSLLTSSQELSLILTFNYLYIKYQDDAFKEKLYQELEANQLSIDKFQKWYKTFKDWSQKFLKYQNRNSFHFEKMIENAQQIKKRHFYTGRKGINISTIHSFKGWQTSTLFLLIDPASRKGSEELIYTGLTRCQQNLIIINCGNDYYHDFLNNTINKINSQ